MRSSAVIRGSIALDTSIWASTAYLSLIPELSQLNTISLEHIIDQSQIDRHGSFGFQTKLLHEGARLYRVHFVKKGDPPASLIIGGRDHNHFFLLAGMDAQIMVRIPSGNTLLDGLSMEGYSPSLALLEVNRLVRELNSLDELATSVNREYTQEVINRQLREMADSSTHPLVSLYALWHSDFEEHRVEEPGWYRQYFRKWKEENSTYFEEFRQEAGVGRNSYGLVILVPTLFILLVLFVLLIRSRKDSSGPDLGELTIQERKVYAMLRLGHSNKEIAQELSVSVSTIKTHVNSIFNKLGLTSRREIMDFQP